VFDAFVSRGCSAPASPRRAIVQEASPQRVRRWRTGATPLISRVSRLARVSRPAQLAQLARRDSLLFVPRRELQRRWLPPWRVVAIDPA
jgi:hypothetical protein